ncbi:hypothetical protein NQ317_010261 [Molorchus minor]|uniref:Uncharacterized protein n=1 Tax=Molorchus minor TaxID=1323400 RepID=A0ABQ9JF31_9CUCU|nr:hypothetical protein NQ317_010261 [Molorchus minor]
MGKIYPQSVIFIDHQVKRDSKLVKWVKLWPIIFDKNDPSYPDAVEKRKFGKLLRIIWRVRVIYYFMWLQVIT